MTAPPHPAVAGRDPHSVEVGCALCGEALAAGDEVVRCRSCSAAYHAECWRFLGARCARLGCTGEREEAVTPAPTVATLRIEEAEIAAERPQWSPLQQRDLLAGAWATPYRAVIAGVLLGLLVAALFRGAAVALPWALGERRLADVPAFLLFAALGRTSWWLWAAGGGAYGALHHAYLGGRLPRLYPALRAALTLVLLSSLAFYVSRLLFLPTYRWPSLLWGLPATLSWLPPVAAWFLLAGSALYTISAYTQSTSLFTTLLQAAWMLVLLASNAYLNAVIPGLGGYLLGWLLGHGANLLWSGHDLPSRAGHWGLVALANLGFLLGAVLPCLRRHRPSR